MLELNNKQIAFLSREVCNAGLTYSHLQDELIDHLCCDVEYHMQTGLSFEMAYERVKQSIGINGLQRIQTDTLLLIDKNYRMMKTTMKIFGLLAPVLIAMGTVFKIEHLTGASIMLVLGFFFLAFVFLPSAVYVSYREISNRRNLTVHLTGFLGAFFVALSFLFKIQHWPLASIWIILGIGIAVLGFLPALLVQKLKEAQTRGQKLGISFTAVGGFIYLTGFLCKVQHWPGAPLMFWAGALMLFLIAFPLSTYIQFKDYKHISSKFIFTSIVVVWVIIPIMLMAVNVSHDYVSDFSESIRDKEVNIQHFSQQNELMYRNLANDSVALKELKTRSNEIYANIENLKYQFINKSQGSNIQPDNARINELVTNAKDANFDMAIVQLLYNTKNGEIYRMYSLINDYNKFISKTFVGINTEIFPNAASDSTAQIPRDLMVCSLLTAYNKLTYLQESVRLTENQALILWASKRTITKTN